MWPRLPQTLRVQGKAPFRGGKPQHGGVCGRAPCADRIIRATGLLVRPVVGWGNVQRGDDEA